MWFCAKSQTKAAILNDHIPVRRLRFYLLRCWLLLNDREWDT